MSERDFDIGEIIDSWRTEEEMQESLEQYTVEVVTEHLNYLDLCKKIGEWFWKIHAGEDYDIATDEWNDIVVPMLDTYRDTIQDHAGIFIEDDDGVSIESSNDFIKFDGEHTYPRFDIDAVRMGFDPHKSQSEQESDKHDEGVL